MTCLKFIVIIVARLVVSSRCPCNKIARNAMDRRFLINCQLTTQKPLQSHQHRFNNDPLQFKFASPSSASGFYFALTCMCVLSMKYSQLMDAFRIVLSPLSPQNPTVSDMSQKLRTIAIVHKGCIMGTSPLRVWGHVIYYVYCYVTLRIV